MLLQVSYTLSCNVTQTIYSFKCKTLFIIVDTWAAFLVVHSDVADAVAVSDVPRSPGKTEDNIRREEECDSEAGWVPDTLQLLSLLDRQYWETEWQTVCNTTCIMGNVIPRCLVLGTSPHQLSPWLLLLETLVLLIQYVPGVSYLLPEVPHSRWTPYDL